jgi:hypothetical protein
MILEQGHKLNDSNQDKIGVSVKKLIDECMAQNRSNPNTPVMEVFVYSAVKVALAQYKELGRGIILGLQMRIEQDFLYVPQANTSTALWMTNLQFKREVATVVQKYEPTKEVVIVMVVPPTVQLFVTQPNGAMEMVAIAEVELSEINVPPGVSFSKEQKGDNFYFVFNHSELGKLGRIVLKSHPGTGQTEIKCEIVDAGGFSPNARKRAEIFYPLAQELIARLEMGLQK